MQTLGLAAKPPRDPPPPETIQFLTIELAPNADGRVYVGVTATICEREGEFENMDMASERVASIDEALATIRDAFIATTHAATGAFQ